MRRNRLLVGAALAGFLAFTVGEQRAFAQLTTGGAGVSSGFGGGGTTGGSSPGGGFTGGGSMPGGGFTGGGAQPGGGFTGGGSTGTGGFTGGGTGFTGGGALTTAGSSGTVVPSAVNPFLSTYSNPLGIGLLDVSGKPTTNKAFGQPLYSLYSTATTTTATALANSAAFSFNTNGMGRTVVYSATLSDDMPRVVHPNSQLQAVLTDALMRSTSLRQPGAIRLRVVDNGTVVLDGTVASPKEKRVTEGMIRLTPGVRNVVNNLEVTDILPRPKTGSPPMLGP
jgi:hypothetical protein